MLAVVEGSDWSATHPGIPKLLIVNGRHFVLAIVTFTHLHLFVHIMQLSHG